MTPMILTGRYQSKHITNELHAPMRTTRGAPRFPLNYELVGALSALFPPADVFARADEGAEVYTRLYRQHLDITFRDADEAEAYLTVEAAKHPGKVPVLLCFCDVAKPGVFCHRRIFAKWYEEKTGDSIPEL